LRGLKRLNGDGGIPSAQLAPILLYLAFHKVKILRRVRECELVCSGAPPFERFEYVQQTHPREPVHDCRETRRLFRMSRPGIVELDKGITNYCRAMHAV
jgi:hypothetical protein